MHDGRPAIRPREGRADAGPEGAGMLAPSVRLPAGASQRRPAGRRTRNRAAAASAGRAAR
ncbi:MAG: hypothetical protein WKG07_04060 [Hymenobacter sp.]